MNRYWTANTQTLIIKVAKTARGLNQMEQRYSVVHPAGIKAATEKNVAASLPDLNGKTVGLLWNYGFRGDETFPIVEKKLRELYPQINIVGYQDFGNFHDPVIEAQMMAELPDKIKSYGCDAVIVGNGC